MVALTILNVVLVSISKVNASTKGHPWRLTYYEAYANEQDARDREKHLKYHGQALAQLKRRIKRSLGKS